MSHPLGSQAHSHLSQWMCRCSAISAAVRPKLSFLRRRTHPSQAGWVPGLSSAACRIPKKTCSLAHLETSSAAHLAFTSLPAPVAAYHSHSNKGSCRSSRVRPQHSFRRRLRGPPQPATFLGSPSSQQLDSGKSGLRMSDAKAVGPAIDMPTEKTPLLDQQVVHFGAVPPEQETGRTRLPFPHEHVSLFSRLSFSYLRPFFSKGRPLRSSDLYDAPEHLSGDFNAQCIYAAWDAEVAAYPTNPSLARAVLRSGAMRSFFSAAPLKLLYDIALLATPVVFGEIIRWFSGTSSLFIGLGHVALLFALSMVTDAVLLPTYFYKCATSGIRTDRSLALLLQRKAPRLASTGRGSSGELVSLLSVDCKSMDEKIFMYLHLLWSAPLQIAICVIMLLRLVGVAALFGVVIMCIASALAMLQARIASVFVEKKMEISDERLRRLSELFEICRQVKMFAWERVFQKTIGEKRDEQLKWTWRAGIMDSLGWGLWDATPILVAAATFAVASSSWFPLSPPLTPANVFPALAIFDIVKFPLTVAPEVIQGLVVARVSLRRIVQFLMSNEVIGRLEDENAVLRDTRAAAFCGGKLLWGNTTVLRDIAFEIPKDKLTMIVGPVGAGKTSLLAGLLGEMTWDLDDDRDENASRPRLNGKTIGYVPQSPWIFNATVRRNILFHDKNPFDEERYARVIEACGLEQDLAIMPAHDSTEIGSRGLTLSGGQRARIALARAVYARSETYIFDGTLAALDAHLAAHVFKRVLGPDGLLADRTRIFVTHSLELCPQADMVITVRGGRVISLRNQIDHSVMGTVVGNMPTGMPDLKDFSDTEPAKGALASDSSRKEAAVVDGRITSDELEHDAGLSTRDVMWYVCFAGVVLPLFSVITIFCSQALVLSVDLTVARWTGTIRDSMLEPIISSTSAFAIQHYFSLMIALSLICCVFQVGKQIISMFASIRVARDLHNAMLASVLRAPLSFFDETPLGRLLNRFGGDISNVDVQLPLHLTAGLSYFFSTGLMVLMVFKITPLAIVVTVPVSLAYFRFTAEFAKAKKEVQRLKSASESPLYSCFQESLAGMEVIRAFDRAEVQLDVFKSCLDANTRASMMTTFGNRYLDGRVATMGAVSIASAGCAAIFARGFITPSLAALSLLWAFKVAAPLRWLPSVWAQIETGLVGADRIHSYVSYLPQEAPAWLPSDNTLVLHQWPSKGELKLDSISMRYRPQFPLALRNLSISIHPGQRVGIVGRSGSGKSSLMMALLRLVEIESGRIEIDGVDIRGVGLDLLRSRVCVIPQEPALFRGTIRSNIDPENKLGDAEVWDALDRAQMRNVVQAMGGLDGMVDDAGHNFSAGERQLMALARALCRQCRVIVMDEASSNVDWDTDAKIQRTIREHLGDATMLIIAHRLRTVADCDAVVVLQDGAVVEGPSSPKLLLEDASSRISALAREMGPGVLEELKHLGAK